MFLFRQLDNDDANIDENDINIFSGQTKPGNLTLRSFLQAGDFILAENIKLILESLTARVQTQNWMKFFKNS